MWHEFVIDTAKMAKKEGIINLYKSAFFIEKKPAEELIDVIDIFSISLKSISPVFYTKYTKGHLKAVLDGIKLVAASDKHLEISQLIVTGRNDTPEEAQRTSNWIVENIGEDVPLHFVGFHPAHQYTKTTRTPFETLLRAKECANREGVKYCYIGNVFKENINDTTCSRCGAILVKRFGMITEVKGLDEESHCLQCGQISPIIAPYQKDFPKINQIELNCGKRFNYRWNDNVNSIHIETKDGVRDEFPIMVIRHPGGRSNIRYIKNDLQRLIISKSSMKEESIELLYDNRINLKLFPILDRAHFPTQSIGE